MAKEDCRWPTMLEEETRRWRVCHVPHAQPTHDECETGKNHNVGACGSRTGLSGGGRQQLRLLLRWAVSSALEVGISKKHPMALLLFSVLPKILSKNLSF